MTPKLIVGLKTLQKEDWNGLKKYIQMQSGEDTITYKCFALLNSQKSRLDRFDTKKWHRTYMPELSEKAYLNTLSKLYILLEEWIVHRNVQLDKVRSGIELVKHWNRCGEYKLADAKAKQVQALLDQNDKYSPEYDYYQYQLYYYQFYSDNPIKGLDPSLIIKMLDQFITCRDQESLLLSTQLRYWSNIKSVDSNIYDRVQDGLARKGEKVDEFYHQLQNMIATKNVDSFQFCLGHIINGKVREGDDLMVFCVMYLLNTALQLWHNGRQISKEEIVSIYEFALNNDILTQSGKIPFARFITIVNSIGAFKPVEWTDNFIAKWGAHVQTSDVDSTVLFARAFNNFNHGNYVDSINLISKINTKFVNSRGNIHRLSIMLFYETRAENFDQLIDAIGRYRLFLIRRKVDIGNNAYSRGNNFIKLLVLLSKADLDAEKLTKHLPTNNKKWISEKINKKS